jgi:hypothetical protein
MPTSKADARVFALAQRIRECNDALEVADKAVEDAPKAATAVAMKAWKDASAALHAATTALAAAVPTSLPALAQLADAALLTGNPDLLKTLRDRLLALAVEKDGEVVQCA